MLDRDIINQRLHERYFMDFSDTSAERHIVTVSQLNRRARQLLETHFPLLWVEGELSNFAKPSSGHWYFTLKDTDAQVRCAMFRNRNNLVKFTPDNGLQVLVRCRVGLYEGRGEFQLIIEHMEEAGHGALQRKFEALKAQLADEGLFDIEHKTPVPELPGCIGVITSPTGAAIRDVLTVLERRFAAIPVVIYPVAVQGAAAAPEIIAAIEQANQSPRCDVLIIGRGGGSLEDLWAFNEESVARAIYSSTIPIVSAVGHEVDFTIADFVADLRAATPSAAAELVSPDGDEMLATITGMGILLQQALNRQLQRRADQLESLQCRLRHPGERLRERNQQLDHLEVQLINSLKVQLHQWRAQLHQYTSRLNRFHPEDQVGQLRQQLDSLNHRLELSATHHLTAKQQQLGKITELLDAISPLNTLSRGYAIITDEKDRIVRKTRDIQLNQTVTARVSDGNFDCEVKKITRIE